MTESGLVLLAVVLVAIAVAGVCRKLDISAALPVIAAGVLLSFLNPFVGQVLAPEGVLILLLAPLLFATALQSSYLDLRQASRPILALAVGLVLLTTLTVGVVTANLVAAIPLAAACALGAVLAPTDAVSAASVGRTTGLPRRVLVIVEGETLVNDGAALTVLKVALIAVAAGTVTAGQVVVALSESLVWGVAGGVLVGWLVASVLTRVPDILVGNALLLVAPFGAYLVTEHVGGSGLLAVVIAGLWIAHASSGGRFDMRLQSEVVWSELAFLLESLAFIFVGIELRFVINANGVPMPAFLGLVVVITTVLVATRLLFVAAARLVSRGSPDRLTRRGALVVAWAGARGPVSLLAAFSIPVTNSSGALFHARDLLLSVTFGVVVLTLVIATSLGPLVRRLGLEPDDNDEVLAAARDRAAFAAVARLEELVDEAEASGSPRLPAHIVEGLRTMVLHRRKVASRGGLSRTYLQWRQEMLETERAELERMRDEGGLSDVLMRQLWREIDLREGALRR